MSLAHRFALTFFVLFAASEAMAVGVAARVNGAHPVGEPIEFAANGVGAADLTFVWDFGDGKKSEPSAEGTASHVYDEPGHYPVIVVAKDATGARSDSFLQTVHRTLSGQAPESSSTIVHHRALGKVCNVNADNHTVSCLSTSDLDLEFEVPVGRHPRTLAVSPDGSLWVVNQDDATISVVSGDDGALLGTIVLPRASMPFGIVIDSGRGVAFVTLQALGQVAEIHLYTGEVLRRVDAGPWPTGIGLRPEDGRLFVTRFISGPDSGEVVELDADSLLVVRTFRLAMDPGPDTEATARGVPNYLRSVVPSPDGALLWVPSKKDNIVRGLARDGQPLTFETSVRSIISLIDPQSNKEVLKQRVDINNRSLGLALTFSRLGDYAFVALLGNNGVEILDAYNRRIVGGRLELGLAPDGLVLDDNGRLYLNASLSRTVVVLDAAPVLDSTNFVLETLADVLVSEAEQLDREVLAGKRLFYNAADPRMGRDGYISCATCHLDGFEDGQVWDFTDRGEGLRNTTSLLGKRGVGQGRLHWSANFDEVQDFEHDMRGPFGGTGFLDDETFNEGENNKTLGDPKAGLSDELDSLAAYVTSLDQVSPSPERDADGMLTPEAWKGLEVFERAGCPTCHGGPDFTDSLAGVVHDVGTMTATSGERMGKPLKGIDTPTLRGIWQTAPYLHDGSAATLGDVLTSRNPGDKHGVTSTLDDEELEQLVAYLRQIDNVAREDELEPEQAEAAGDSESSGGGCSVAQASRLMGSGQGAGLLLAGLLLFVRRRERLLRQTLALQNFRPLGRFSTSTAHEDVG